MAPLRASWCCTLALAAACGDGSGAADASSEGGMSGNDDGTASATSTATTSASTGTADASSGGADVSSGPTDDGATDSSTDCDPAGLGLTAQEQMLLDLPADTWWQAEASMIRPLCPDDREGCQNVIEAWSGGAFDPVHNRMLIFGGGHADYSGNEVYGFDIATLAWQRLTEPSPVEYMNEDPLSDGQPVSRHSYDGIVYLAHVDKLLAHGGSRWQDGSGTGVTWELDGASLVWTDVQPTDAPMLSNCCSEASTYDPVSGRAFFHITNRLVAYDHDGNRWEQLLDLGYPPLWPRYEVSGDKRGTFDPTRGLVWFFGAGLYMVYDPATATVVTDDWIATGGAAFSNADAVEGYPDQVIMTGGGEVITATAPGIDYDAAADAIVGWVGGGPWVLDLAAKAWSQGSADGAPAGPTSTGTFGRWRYIERTNVFVLVNSVDDDVHFYKHTAGCGR